MKRKAKINSVLEKKLEELEYLREAISVDDSNPNLHNEIKHSVLFAKTLLTAEISSRRTDTEGEEDNEETLELRYMAKRLTELEEAFKTNQFSVHDNGLFEPVSLETNDGVVEGETGSVYSWVESCKKEFGKPEEEVEEEKEDDVEQCLLFVDASSEEKIDVTLPALATVKNEEVVVREVNEKRRLGFRASICFGLIGLVSGMMFGFLIGNTKDGNYFLTPT